MTTPVLNVKGTGKHELGDSRNGRGSVKTRLVRGSTFHLLMLYKVVSFTDPLSLMSEDPSKFQE